MEKNKETKKHAFLSPSAAHRWLNCTASPSLEAGFPESGSDYAEEGTLAHACAAMKVKAALGRDTSDEEKEIASLIRYASGEMGEYTDAYRDFVLEHSGAVKDATVIIEQRLDYSAYVPDMYRGDAFGTGDCVIVGDGTLEVIDFKYGKGVRVDARLNPQMMLYALAAYDCYELDYEIRDVRMTIYQPRMDNISTWEMTVEALLEWARSILEVRAREVALGGVQRPGEWCRFCKAAAMCRETASTSLAAVKASEDPLLLSPEDVAAKVLPYIPMVEMWISKVKDYVLGQALSGVKYPGWKLVEGRSMRRISDPDKVVACLREKGFDDEQILKPREIRTIGDLEKLVGKKRFAQICKQWITKPAGKPALVEESDKRPEYNPAVMDFKDLKLE